MRASRPQAAAIVVFSAGLIAGAIGLERYDEAYAWIAHTTDVRVVIGRAVGNAGRVPSCEGLRRDAAELARLTADDSTQQARLPALEASVALVCAGRPAPDLVDQLAKMDSAERALITVRRARLRATRRWTLVALILSTLAAIIAVVYARFLQKRAVRALSASEERFRMFATSSRDLIRVHEPDGRPSYVSPSVEHVLGYTPAEVMGERPLWLGHPDDLDRMRASLAAVQVRGAPASTLVYRLRGKDGAYRWFETHTNPIRDRAGALLRFYTTARDITDRVELEGKLERAAVTDELTGLLNRRGFTMIAGQEHRVAIREQHGLAVIFADLDGLKTINDRLGHDQGDAAICAFAKILRDTFRESDVVARLGGDEYAALAYHVDGPAVEALLDRLRAAVAAAPPIGPYPLAVSLGVALLAAGDKTPLDALLADADQRMYEAKRARRPIEPR